MAVQAQYPSTAFAPDFHRRARNGSIEEQQIGGLFGAYATLGGHSFPSQVFNATVFSEPESELTCNAPASRKRARDDAIPLAHSQQQMSPQFPFVSTPLPLKASAPEKVVAASAASGPAVSNCFQISYEDSRLNESATTSTSGRSPASFYAPPAAIAPLAQDFFSHIYRQNMEIDTLIRLQNAKLRTGLEDARKRHCRSLLSVLEQQVTKRLKDKETELENAIRRNAELEEKVKQMSTESQIWFNLAKNNEAYVSSLRSSLEQVLQNNNYNGNSAAAHDAKEGYGDSGGGPLFPADDAQSCCFDEAAAERSRANETEIVVRENQELRCRKACKACMENEVSVLLLPCRHLCLCKECESRLDTCPICKTIKNASLQIFMS